MGGGTGMTKQLIMFQGNETNLRISMIDDQPWFAVKDVACALGYKNSRAASKAHVEYKDKKSLPVMTTTGVHNMICVNESGIYALVLRSHLPNAKKFTHWVTSVVLPSIRKAQQGTFDPTKPIILKEEILSPPATEVCAFHDLDKNRVPEVLPVHPPVIANRFTHTCTNCLTVTTNPEAKFCWKCGREIKTTEELLIDELQSLCGHAKHLPAESRDQFIRTINSAVSYIKNDGVIELKGANE